MTEEIEAHVLKKYEILQKLGMSILSSYVTSSLAQPIETRQKLISW